MRLGTMKTILFSLITLSFGVTLVASPVELATIQTLQGKTYRQCKVLKRDADGVAFSHLNGTARVLFADLPEATRHELGYDAGEAAALQKSREKTRKEKLEEERSLQKKRLERIESARLAEIKRLSQQSQIIVVQGSSPYYYGQPPIVGFGGVGWVSGFGGWQVPPPGTPAAPTPRNRGWDNIGNATIGAGSGGIYVPQSGGFQFSGFPQIHYSPTLGYYTPGFNGPSAVAQSNVFGFVPGLGPPPSPPATVPGVAVHGSASIPMGH